MVAGRILQHLGYQVTLAESGLRALEIYRQERDRIDLVILDMLMPAMGGAETFQKLKEIDPGVRVLLSSGYSLDGEAQQAMAAGARGFIQKPYRLAVLSYKVGPGKSWHAVLNDGVQTLGFLLPGRRGYANCNPVLAWDYDRPGLQPLPRRCLR
jgi:CheY-like chemotaxis protein